MALTPLKSKVSLSRFLIIKSRYEERLAGARRKDNPYDLRTFDWQKK
jgi:hypothetical protein